LRLSGDDRTRQRDDEDQCLLHRISHSRFLLYHKNFGPGFYSAFSELCLNGAWLKQKMLELSE
jgi:hypothetical protein